MHQIVEVTKNKSSTFICLTFETYLIKEMKNTKNVSISEIYS